MSTPPLSHHLWTLLALVGLLLASAGSALLALGPFNLILNLALSAAQMLLLMGVFMHETGIRNLTRLASALGFIWLAMLLALSLLDFLTRSRVPAPWR
ncbi:MAG: hypothetical protein WAU56_12875 [Steroidobacteraceae bacterium]